MRRFAFFLALFIACLVCSAKTTMIEPQYVVGDTLKYRTTATVSFYILGDSMVITSKMLPVVIVESQNDTGFVLGASNKFESVDVQTSRKEETESSAQMIERMTSIPPVDFTIQLDKAGRPDSILDLEEVKELMIENYMDYLANQEGVDLEENPEWAETNLSVAESVIERISQPQHLIKNQFGNLPYFTFTGIPLESEEIPASLLLTDETAVLVKNLEDLHLQVVQPADKKFTLVISGQDESAEIECTLNYENGIMQTGDLTITHQAGAPLIIYKFTLTAL